MSYSMSFSRLATYDAGLPGISVEATLSLSANEAVTLSAKLDTGSTNCVFARRHGEALGLVIENGEPARISTATGSFLVYRHEITLTVLGLSFDAQIYFADDEFFNRNVLGRQGFLDRAQLGLVDNEGKLYLGSYDE